MNLRQFTEWAETYIISVIRGRRESPWDDVLRGVLFMASRLFRTIVLWRISLYRHRLFHNHALGCQVISIGNLTVGGTGKTPVVEVFSRTLAQKGRRVAVLSRGYRSKPKPFYRRLLDGLGLEAVESPPRVVSDGERLLLDSEMAGDEPYMLASNLKNVVVLTDPDRVKSGRHAIRKFNCDTLILDDGFQYLPLRPHVNILLVDSSDPFNNHHLLPRGLLREPIRNLRRADMIFLTKSDGSPKLKHLKRFIKRHNHHAEIVECTHRPQHLQDVYTKEILDLSHLAGRKVASICGIAAPESFENFLRNFHSELVYCERFADHHRYSQQEIIDFVNAAALAGAEMVLTTEKDAVRFPKLDRRDIPVLFMRVEIDILSGQESFDDFISRICFSQRPSWVAEHFMDDDDFDDPADFEHPAYDHSRDGL